MSAVTEFRYNRLTWPEMNEAIALEKLVILPTGSTEQHGPHLPLDVDLFLCESVCLEVGRRCPEQVLVLPGHRVWLEPAPHRFPRHDSHRAGDIHRLLLEHYQERRLPRLPTHPAVNGHGSNTPLIDLVARKTVLATSSLCFATGYYLFLMEAFAKVRESAVIAHADEFETSLYLHLAGERVQMDKAIEDNDRRGQFLSSDSTGNYPVRFNDYWGRWTKTGVHGDPTKATAEKGRILFEAAVTGLIDLVHELRTWPIEKLSDQHAHPVQAQIRW
jgi:creatinine amidohydrolase